MRNVNKFFENDEIVYRRGLNIKAIADEILATALNELYPDGEQAAIDKGLTGIMTTWSDIATNEFINKIKLAVNAILEELPARTEYRHIGYYDEIPDILELGGKSADEILDYYMHGHGHFYEDDYTDDEANLVKEEEEDAIAEGSVRFTSNGKFAIFDSSSPEWNKELEKKEPGDDSDCYIDIYQLID